MKCATASPRIFDGGISTEIYRRGVKLHPICWSGQTSYTHSQLVKDIHKSYIQAGASIITTNTFASSKHVLDAAGYGDLFESINRLSVQIALESKLESDTKDLLVAGSISTLPPLNMADRAPEGSEVDQNYRCQADILASCGVDFILIEMQYDSKSTCRLISACLETGLPVWVGITASKLATGELIAYRPPGKYASLPIETFQALVSSINRYPISGIGVMHTPIHILAEALSILKEFWTGPSFAYPETGCFSEPNWDFHDSIAPQPFATIMRDLAQTFELDAVGGCCGTTPEHIKSLSHAIGHQN